jgi:hypothetical protein
VVEVIVVAGDAVNVVVADDHFGPESLSLSSMLSFQSSVSSSSLLLSLTLSLML